MCAAPARPVTDYDTKQHKADANGELLYNLQVVALPWSMGDRSGVAFRVERLESQGVTGAPRHQEKAAA